MLRYCSNKVRDDSAHGAYAKVPPGLSKLVIRLVLVLTLSQLQRPWDPKRPSFLPLCDPSFPTKDNRELRQPAARLLATPFNFRAEI